MLLGIDEVGRGPWAGPLVVGAVILGDNFPEIGLTDSKKLTPKKRAKLSPIILERALATGLGWVSSTELDQYGLSASLKLATRRAVKPILKQLSEQSDINTQTHQGESSHTNSLTSSPQELKIIIDGTVNFLTGTPIEDRVSTLKKADLLVPEVSAASIIAKVARDDYMVKIAAQYPAYGFEKHVGYGTALHQKALLEHGICPEHRQSFRPIREILAKMPDFRPNSSNFSPFSSPPGQNSPVSAISSANNSIPPSHTTIGKTAELAVANHLKQQNHQILACNFRTKSYEIDLISIKNHQIFFTEVKYSANLHCEGSPLVRITPKKQQQMRFAAECFIKSHPEYQDFQPLLAAAAVSGEAYQVDDWFILG